MNSRDMEKANYVRKLFEEMMAKVDQKKDHKGRHEEAEQMMDDKLGKGWRKYAKPAEGVTVVEVGFVAEPPSESKLLRDMRKLGDEEGLGDKGSEDMPEEWNNQPECGKHAKVAKIIKMLRELV